MFSQVLYLLYHRHIIKIYGLALDHGNYLSMDLTALMNIKLRIMFSTRGRKCHLKNGVKCFTIFISAIDITSFEIIMLIGDTCYGLTVCVSVLKVLRGQCG